MRLRRSAALVAGLFGLLILTGSRPDADARATVDDVLNTYADIAHAGYDDSLNTAKRLREAVDELLAAPSEQTLKAARAAWIAARQPYTQTEVFRFGNPAVDAWEGGVNAWPLDEGLIDYVAESYGAQSPGNQLYTANVIANPTLTIGGETIDGSTISAKLLTETLHEAGGIEANVATGYHAIEFLLWGQDLNGTGPGAGARPATDFGLENCTHGHCERRREYLKVVTDLLIDDLAAMTTRWAKDGDIRKELLAKGSLVPILKGMGSLSYGELAGERMKLGLLLNDPEEEQDCFSDNTHNAHYFNALGIQNVYLGRYARVDGTEVKGASVSDIVADVAPQTDLALKEALNQTLEAMRAIVASAHAGISYDQLIAPDNPGGNALVETAIEALLRQTREIERAVAALQLGTVPFEGSDSLDAADSIGR